MKLEDDETIIEATIINPYQLPRVIGEKASIIDIRAKDKKGRQFVIEMQVADVDGFDKRVQYYTCRDYSMQIERGQQYPLLKPTYFIGILDLPAGRYSFIEFSHKCGSYYFVVTKQTS